MSYVHVIAQDEEVIASYFDLLENTLVQNNILDNPSKIYNCDETGMPLNPKPLKGVCQKGMKDPSHITGNSKAQISILACTNAAGYALPPYVIFDQKTLNHNLTVGEVPGTVYGLSSTGWMDTELFKEWFMKHFLSYIPSSRPILLLMDGHSSHFCPEMITLAAEEGIVLFTLPPNTTHMCEPLDKGPFAPLKIEWRKTVHNFIATNRGRAVTKYDFSALFSEAWYKAMSIKNITAGFRTTGVCPFDSNAIKLVKENDTMPTAKPIHKDIKYIPLLTPSQLQHKTKHIISTPAVNYESETSASSMSFHDSSLHSCTQDMTSLMNRSASESDLQSPSMKCFQPIKRANSLSRFLITPILPSRRQAGPKPNGRVLTSLENRKLMEEKIKTKETKETEKQFRIKLVKKKKLRRKKRKSRKRKLRF